MSYATESDLLVLDLPAAAIAGLDTQPHLDAASSRVDGYLRGRYSLPLVAPYPSEIVSVTSALAAYSLIARRGFDPSSGTHLTLRQRFEDSTRWLERLASGMINLPDGADSSGGVDDGGPIIASRCPAEV